MHQQKVSLAFAFLIYPFVSLAADGSLASISCFPQSNYRVKITNASLAGVVKTIDKEGGGYGNIMKPGNEWYFDWKDMDPKASLRSNVRVTVGTSWEYDERGTSLPGPNYNLTLGESGIADHLQELVRVCEGAGWDRGGYTEYDVEEHGSGALVQVKLWGTDDESGNSGELQQGDAPAPITFNATSLPSTRTTTSVSSQLEATARRRVFRA